MSNIQTAISHFVEVEEVKKSLGSAMVEVSELLRNSDADRARQYLADRILGISIDLSNRAENGNTVRIKYGLPMNHARDIQSLVASMALRLAWNISAGRLDLS